MYATFKQLIYRQIEYSNLQWWKESLKEQMENAP